MSDKTEQDRNYLAGEISHREWKDSQLDKEMDSLEEDISVEIISELAGIADPLSCHTRLANDIQPPTSVLSLAARAAAAVFMAFERGYRMG